eukprot:537870_1
MATKITKMLDNNNDDLATVIRFESHNTFLVLLFNDISVSRILTIIHHKLAWITHVINLIIWSAMMLAIGKTYPNVCYLFGLFASLIAMAWLIFLNISLNRNAAKQIMCKFF